MSMDARPDPSNDAALQSAQALLRAGRAAEASARLERLLQAQPDEARGWALQGAALQALGRVDDAAGAWRRALDLRPELPAWRLQLAALLVAQGDVAGARLRLAEGLERSPGHPDLCWELARLQAADEPAAALATLDPLLRQFPAEPELRLSEADLRLRLEPADTALEPLAALLSAQPQALDGAERLLSGLVEADRPLSQRVALARLVAEQAPSAARWLMLSQQLHLAGEFRHAHEVLERALQADPDFLPARWAWFQLPPTPAPDSDAALQEWRRLWDAGVAAFEDIDFSRPQARAQVWGCIGQCTAFHRHYLGDEVTLQPRYGALLRRMMAQLDPGEPLRQLREGRRRIGFCSAYFREHTVARLFVPLIEALDRERFEVFVFSLDDTGDRWSRRLQAVSRFDGRPGDAEQWRQRIHSAQLDVLVYPEIGMHPATQGLAALRLAPVQAALWGHPVSTGMDSIDLVLGADLLEPADAQQRYSERLWRLPKLGHGLRQDDLPVPVAPELGLQPDRIELLCPQTVFKLLPQQDRLFARVLSQLPGARLHLLVDPRAPVRDWLRARMAPVLREARVDPDRVCMHGFLDHAAYLGLARCFPLALDSVGWSGGMSALDLLAQGLPIVTLPGDSMRSRQTAALLHWLELPELVAKDADDYVGKAVALARDPARCAALSAQLRERRARLFGDPATVASLEHLLAGVRRLPDGRLELPP